MSAAHTSGTFLSAVACAFLFFGPAARIASAEDPAPEANEDAASRESIDALFD